MATTNKLTAFNGYYGYAGNAKFSNSAANHLFVGGASGASTYVYRSRMAFKPLSSISAIGANRINITKVLLYLYRDDEGPTTITVGCSSSSAWDASLAATKSVYIGSTNQWYSVDITNMATAIGGYSSNWYIHLRNGTPRLRLKGTGSSYVPYIKVTWEYVAATITSSSDEANLGTSLTFTVTPEVSGETHTLTYSIGDQSGTIATKAGNTIYWTPPTDLATEFTGDETGTAKINMTVYNTSGSVIRTEVYYQTLRAPDSMKPSVYDMGLTMSNSISGYGLAGQTSITLAPSINMGNCYGATLSNIVATITNGSVVQELTWSNASEGNPGIYTGSALTSAVLTTTGSAVVRMVATDTRGRTAESSRTISILSYSPPQIHSFSVERYEPQYNDNEYITGYIASDMGGYVWVNINASVQSVAPYGTQLNKLTWQISGINLSKETVSASGSAAQTLSITKDRSIFSAPVDEGETWQYTLTVTDTAGATAVQYSVVLPAHAAFSVSPDKYGFGVGMIAAGNRNNPMFEVSENYESAFYGGIRGVTDYSTGEVATGGKWIDGKAIYRRVVSVSAEADTLASVDLSGSNIGHVIEISGCAYLKTSMPYYAPISYATFTVAGALSRNVFVYLQDGALKMRGNTAFDAWAIVLYTKNE